MSSGTYTPVAFRSAKQKASDEALWEEASSDADRQGEDMAYAAESVLACFATDIIDVSLSAREQAREISGAPPGKWSLSGIWSRVFGHGDHNRGPAQDPLKTTFIHKNQPELPFTEAHVYDGARGPSGTRPIKGLIYPQVTFWGAVKGQIGHVIGGEVIGDLLSMPTLLVIQRRFPKAFAWLTDCTEAMARPFYDFGAKMSLRGWAKEHGLKAGDAKYDARIEHWKKRQHGNLAKSVIITVSSVIGNIGVQLASNAAHAHISEGHHAPSFGSMLRGKVKGAAATFAVVMGSRLLFPEQMKRLDRWVSGKFFAPALKKWDKIKDASHAQTAGSGINAAEIPSEPVKMDQETKKLEQLSTGGTYSPESGRERETRLAQLESLKTKKTEKLPTFRDRQTMQVETARTL